MNQISQALLSAIINIADEKQIPRDNVVEALQTSIIKAYTKEYPEEILDVKIDIDNKILEVNQVFNVVEDNEELNDYCEISVEEANQYYKSHKIDKVAKIGDILQKPVELASLSKKIVEHIVQLFKQAITRNANINIYNHWKDRIGDVVYAEIENNDRHGISVDLGNGEYGFVSLRDTIPQEKLYPGQKYYFYIKDVKEQSAGWPIILSRTDAGLIKYLLNANIPEIQEKIIEIVKIARVAGFKTKVALLSHQPGIEPCGTVIGIQGVRISGIRNAVNGEKIEVFEYSDDFERFIADVCEPARIAGYKIVSEATADHKKQIIIVISKDQMALLLGSKGSNIRLISQILEADIDVKTMEDMKAEGLSYNRIETKSPRQRAFERVLQRNRESATDFSNFNKPVKKPTAESKLVDGDKNITTSTEQPKSKTYSNTESVLDYIDTFNYESNKEEVEKKDETTTSSTKNKKVAIEQLMANEQNRLQSANATNLEEKIAKKAAKTKKTTKTTKKPKASKAVASAPSTESILDEFKNKDSENILNELAMENDSRELEEDLNDFDSVDDYDFDNSEE